MRLIEKLSRSTWLNGALIAVLLSPTVLTPGCTQPGARGLDAALFSQRERAAILADLAASTAADRIVTHDTLVARWGAEPTMPHAVDTSGEMTYERAVVLQHLVGLGSEPSEARGAVSELSDAQCRALADNPDTITRVGDPATALLLGIIATASLASASDCEPAAPSPPPPPPVISVSDSREWRTRYQEKVRIATEPSGCRIYVGEEYIGISPVETRLDTLPLHLSNSGTYRSQAGRRKGKTKWSHLLEPTLPTSRWTITAILDGYQPMSRDIVISCDEESVKRAIDDVSVSLSGKVPRIIKGERSVLLMLEPVPAVAAIIPEPHVVFIEEPPMPVAEPENTTGTLCVSSSPERCEIFIDGLLVGTTPFDLPLESGAHVIEIKKGGHQDYARRIMIRPQQIVPIHAELAADQEEPPPASGQ